MCVEFFFLANLGCVVMSVISSRVVSMILVLLEVDLILGNRSRF